VRSPPPPPPLSLPLSHFQNSAARMVAPHHPPPPSASFLNETFSESFSWLGIPQGFLAGHIPQGFLAGHIKQGFLAGHITQGQLCPVRCMRAGSPLPKKPGTNLGPCTGCTKSEVVASVGPCIGFTKREVGGQEGVPRFREVRSSPDTRPGCLIYSLAVLFVRY